MLKGKKTYIFAGLTIGAAAWLLWAGALSPEAAIPLMAGGFIAIGFRNALATYAAQILAALIEPRRSRRPEDGEIRYL
ncbi:MAG: hypothetical protein HY653_01010 [Acidobacteria bacterium]|nr:hypothetical protein [Acidobacteriota bacterium]